MSRPFDQAAPALGSSLLPTVSNRKSGFMERQGQRLQRDNLHPASAGPLVHNSGMECAECRFQERSRGLTGHMGHSCYAIGDPTGPVAIEGCQPVDGAWARRSGRVR